MKAFIVAMLLVVWCSFALATKVIPKGLEALVAEADHILVGRIDKVDMVDRLGREVLDDKGQTGPGRGNTIRLHLTVEKNSVLRTNSSTVPDQILIRLWPEWHLTLVTQRKHFEGRTYVFLLKGEDYQWVYPSGFHRPLSEKAEIERLIRLRSSESIAPSMR